MGDFPSFAEFFRAASDGDYDPFPWQARLAHQVDTRGRWPAEIGVPTGLGKTTCLDIAVWSLAKSMATHGSARQLPTRIWYVVNRRLLVDAALDRSRQLQTRLNEAEAGPLEVVARALRDGQGLSWDIGALHVDRFRGGAERGQRAPDPSCPSIMTSTVPMFGSRFLFRGYGTSTGLRPIDAALAGVDTLLLLDESHLAVPLQKLLAQSSELRPPDHAVLGPTRSRPMVVNLTATGGDEDRFALEGDDYACDVIVERLDAPKPTELVECADKAIPTQMAEIAVDHAESLVEAGVTPAVVLFTNTARRAPQVHEALRRAIRASAFGDVHTRVVTGRLRPADATALRAELSAGPLSVASAAPTERDRPVFVIATQTLEVGADFDFDALVTEIAGARSLTQRFGRLNRLGRKPYARAAIVAASDLTEWPVYGTEPAQVWDRLQARVETSLECGDVIQLHPRVIAEAMGPPGDAPPRSPELLPNHLLDWAKTSAPHRPDETPVEPFISGEDDDRATVSVVWRQTLPNRNEDPARVNDPPRLRPVLHPDEAVDLPLGEARRWLDDHRFGIDAAWLFDPDIGGLRPASLEQLRPGRTLVVGSVWGGYSPTAGWSPDSTESVDDLSPRLRSEAVLEAALVARLLGVDDGHSTSDTGPAGTAGQAEAAETAELVDLADQAQHAWTGGRWGRPPPEHLGDDDRLDLVDRVAAELAAHRIRVMADVGQPLVVSLAGDAVEAVTATRPRLDADDGLTLQADTPADRATLAAHLTHVGDKAERIATALGLPAPLVGALSLAGRLHDAGKADPRFQQMLGADPAQVMAKSVDANAVRRGAWPNGGRHEALSAIAFDAWLAATGQADRSTIDGDIDVDLVRHLVLTHHGHGRPLVPWIPDDGEILLALTLEGHSVSTSASLAAVDLSQPARFAQLCRRYGWWGLALLETVLRQADHAESSTTGQQGATRTMEVS